MVETVSGKKNRKNMLLNEALLIYMNRRHNKQIEKKKVTWMCEKYLDFESVKNAVTGTDFSFFFVNLRIGHSL